MSSSCWWASPCEEKVINKQLISPYLLTKPRVVDYWYLKPYHEDYCIDNRKRRPHGCSDHLTVLNGAPQIRTRLPLRSVPASGTSPGESG